MSGSLYICYFGLREPLVQTQVLPYLREILKGGNSVTIFTFEPDLRKNWTVQQIDDERKNLESEGITWRCFSYHKWPSIPATLFDIFVGSFHVWREIVRSKPDILHGRVHLPTLMGALARKFSKHKPALLFDIRGFFPEEYTDAGIWPQDGLVFRSVKRLERWLMKESDGFVVLTENARNILFPESRGSGFDCNGRPVEVIPCCVDFNRRFSEHGETLRNETRRDLGVSDRYVVAHVGALTGLYLDEEIANFLGVAKASNPKTFALLLTQTDPKRIRALLESQGYTDKDMFIAKVHPADVQKYLEASDVALSFVKAGYATASRSPTKIPEYLACGLPIIANPGVGDVDEVIEANRVGAVTKDLSAASFLDALREVGKLDNLDERCRETAKREFDLETVGGVRYRRLYDRLISRHSNKGMSREGIG